MLFHDIDNNPHFIREEHGDDYHGYVRYNVNHKVVNADEYIVFDGSAVEAIVRHNNDEHMHIRFTAIGDTGRRLDELVPIREEVLMHLANVESIDIKYTGIKEI